MNLSQLAGKEKLYCNNNLIYKSSLKCYVQSFSIIMSQMTPAFS